MGWNGVLALITRLYPEAWRTRYEDELTALVEDQLADPDSVPWRIALGCLWGALSERLNPSVRRARAMVPAVAGQPGFGVPAPRRSTKRLALIVGSIVGIATTVLVVLAMLLWFFSIKPSLDNLGIGFEHLQTVMTAGPTAAFEATAEARSIGVPVGQVTAPELAGVDSHFRWVPGTSMSPVANGSKHSPWTASVSASDQHVVAGVQSGRGICSFGLSVTSGSDPIIAADHLSGPGLYQAFLPFQAGHPDGQVPCAAANAPGTGWTVPSTTP
jgi:hypothetical protein